MKEIHRYRAVQMITAEGNRIGYDPHGPDVVMAAAYDSLREQLEDALEVERSISMRHDVLADSFKEQANELKEVRLQLTEIVSAFRSINFGPAHAIELPGDDEPCYPQRKEWIEWLLGLCDEASPANCKPAAQTALAQAVENAGKVAHLYNSGAGLLAWIRSEHDAIAAKENNA